MLYQSNIRVPKPTKLLEQEISLPTLYLQEDTKIELAEEPGYLYLLHPDHSYAQSIFPLNATRAILAFEPVEIGSRALSALMRSSIPIIIFSAEGELVGRIEPNYTSRPDLIKAQALMNDSQRLQLMLSSVWGILRRCRRFLMRSSRRPGSLNMNKACQELQLTIDLVFRQDSISSLQGLLGRGMALYYGALPFCINNDWDFQGRQDNSPTNRMLNFAYQLLEESVKTGVYAAGLNPTQGFWHESYRNQQGMVADLTSELKLFADAAVIRALNRGQVVPKDFDGNWNNKLPPIAVKAISSSFQRKMSETFTYPHTKLQCSYQELCYLQAKQVAWLLCMEIDEYYSPDLK